MHLLTCTREQMLDEGIGNAFEWEGANQRSCNSSCSSHKLDILLDPRLQDNVHATRVLYFVKLPCFASPAQYICCYMTHALLCLLLMDDILSLELLYLLRFFHDISTLTFQQHTQPFRLC